ncbi:NADH-quinone oxidoreductase subunit L [Lacunisphaera limnophila]|uniref:NADH-quinone oxidoreductase subunit L n=1 Tax=Lacunisphaera limnophila TaxID=1838286 RepID=A0A1D8AVC3_9BACT|nr:NADH-quinone oxidoreductase subunit L [Lacunisphaera limnophila]AOS44796.1 NADH-quinone oxidoreductase subunit L [Lacunisphaera limnophila]
MTLAAQHLWLIPALPLAAAAVGALVPRSGRTIAAGAALAAMAGAFLLSCLALAGALADPAAHQVFNFSWFDLGATTLRLGFLLDPLTAFMCVMVTFVSFLIFVFSTGYMQEDANFKQFFCFLSLFAAAMLGLLVANSLLLLFVCWELVGLASYLLIGFWFHKPSAAAAAKKAFITTRIGDLGFLLGLLWLQDSQGTLLFYDGGAGFLESASLAQLAQLLPCGLAASTAIGLLLFCGAVGKSGQFPLHVWLPDAMEGPTPVSALIHAATMVAAGVFLIARVFPLMAADQGLTEVPIHALTVVAFIGAITALLGALIAVAQNDIKRILAFSTVSQLGYMMLALGVGSWVAAIFHLLTHAFFKALLFLGAGSVIHAAHHEQDIRSLGGLSDKMKITFLTFTIGTLALVGAPLFFSGFWSKEAILHAAHGWQVSHIPFYAAVVGVVLTAFYNTRLMAETFFGKPRSHASEHAHENKPAMTLPLVVLAVCTILLAFINTPAWPWLDATLLGQTEVHGHSLLEGAGLMGLSVLLVAIGIGAGWALYGRRPRARAESPDPLATRAPGVIAALANRLGFDELYAATFGRLSSGFASFCTFLETYAWDGAVRFLAQLGVYTGVVSRENDEAGLNAGFDATSAKLRGTGVAYSKAQTGEAHGYLRTLALGFVFLLILVILGGAR